ncbi:MAG: outer membrane beta-barrel protein [Acidobacteria bacterium]|nr:outer membrane beta-barrel protein [Acidobacteriota bacterium]
MRWQLIALALGVSVGLAAPTYAQNTNTPGQTGTPATTQAPATQPRTTQAVTPEYRNEHANRWMASGFVGSSFSSDFRASDLSVNNDAAVDFGGSVGYMWRQRVGAEFLADFTPKFDVPDVALFNDEKPAVNSYMVNLIGSIPLGADGQFQPFISGGFGAVQLNGAPLTTSGSLGSAAALINSGDGNDTQFGGDIGAGLMAFRGNWGIRGDVRYFRAAENSDAGNLSDISSLLTTNDTADATPATATLSGLSFWRANIGLAFRW